MRYTTKLLALGGTEWSGDPSTTVHGSASDLVLALYNRIPYTDLRVDGDREVLTELAAWSAAE